MKKRRQSHSTQASSVMAALFTSTQQKVLGLIFGQPQRRYFSTEIIALAGLGSGTVQRELAKLAASGLVTVEKLGMMKFYQANPQAPLFPELTSLFQKMSGIPELLRRALGRTNQEIKLAILFGSTAKGSDTATSDIDLLVVSNQLTLEVLYEALEEVETKTQRKVNPVVYSETEFSKKRKVQDSFVQKVLQQPHHIVLGLLDDSGKTGKPRSN